MIATAVLLAFLACWMTLAWLLRRRHALPMDRPNERSLHTTPTPRIGGLGIIAGIAVAVVAVGTEGLWPAVLAAFALAALSLADDARGLPVWLRFLAHFVAAAGFALALGLTGGALVAATLAIVWMTNLYNFMDGADGLAGGMAVLGFGALALAAGWHGAADLAAISAAVAAAGLAFLRFNFPPARLFMGDAGSIPLGFLAAALGLYGALHDVWSWIFPVWVFSPFIVDATVTLTRRALRAERIWRAHRTHYYQRVVLLGASHRHLAIGTWGLMLVVIGMALAAWAWPRHATALLILTGLVYFAIFLMIDRRWRHRAHER